MYFDFSWHNHLHIAQTELPLLASLLRQPSTHKRVPIYQVLLLLARCADGGNGGGVRVDMFLPRCSFRGLEQAHCRHASWPLAAHRSNDRPPQTGDVHRRNPRASRLYCGRKTSSRKGEVASMSWGEENRPSWHRQGRGRIARHKFSNVLCIVTFMY
jgi:hypothetical protein